jgi:hypothetical protein
MNALVATVITPQAEVNTPPATARVERLASEWAAGRPYAPAAGRWYDRFIPSANVGMGLLWSALIAAYCFLAM